MESGRHNKFLIFGVLCLTMVFGCRLAIAQTLNYGALQDVFNEPVTTAATGTPQRVSEVAADMTIITADQIRQAGSRSIPQIIGIYTPGVNVLQEGTDNYDVGMRGYQQPYNPRLLVLIDGRQVFSDDYSRTPWDNLPVNIDDIRQIEVVKGTSSALFGSNATSGVVNIITYSPLYDSDNVISLNGGTQNSLSADATATAKLGNFGGIKVSAGTLGESSFNFNPNNIIQLPSQDLYHRYASLNGTFKLGSGVLWDSEFTYSKSYDTQAITLFIASPVLTSSYSARTGFTWNSPIGQIKNDNYINHNSLDYGTGTITNSSVLPQNSLIVSRIEDLLDVGSSNTIRVMAEYRHKYNEVMSDPSFEYEKTSLNENVYTIGGTWLSHLTSNLSWTNAIRYDGNNMNLSGTLANTALYPQAAYKQSYATMSVNSGLVYQPSDDDTFRLTYGRGVQDPSLVNNGYNYTYLAVPGFVQQFQGNPFIAPVIVENYELDYDRKIDEIASTLRTAIFYQKNNNLVGVLPQTLDFSNFPTVIGILQEANLGNSHSFGGEIGLNGQYEGFRWDASYSYQKVHDSALVMTLMDNAGSAPQNQLRLSLGYTLGDWEFDIHNQYQTSTSMASSAAGPGVGTHIDGYYSMTGRIGYKITDYLTAALYGSNLTQQNTIENPYDITERRIFLGLTGKF